MAGQATVAAVTAVIFDCDGTLVDSEPLARRAWERTLGGRGYEVSDADFAAVVGHPFAATREFFAERVELPPAEALWPEFSGVLFELIDGELRPFEDALATLAELEAAGVPVAVASSSVRERLDRTLRRVDLHDRFAATVAGDEVAHGKPRPDLFLEAAARLGVEAAGALSWRMPRPGSPPGWLRARGSSAWRAPPGDAAALADAHVVVERLSAKVLLDARPRT